MGPSSTPLTWHHDVCRWACKWPVRVLLWFHRRWICKPVLPSLWCASQQHVIPMFCAPLFRTGAVQIQISLKSLCCTENWTMRWTSSFKESVSMKKCIKVNRLWFVPTCPLFQVHVKVSIPKGIKFVGHPGKHHLTRKKCVAPGEATPTSIVLSFTEVGPANITGIRANSCSPPHTHQLLNFKH